MRRKTIRSSEEAEIGVDAHAGRNNCPKMSINFMAQPTIYPTPAKRIEKNKATTTKTLHVWGAPQKNLRIAAIGGKHR